MSPSLGRLSLLQEPEQRQSWLPSKVEMIRQDEPISNADRLEPVSRELAAP